MNQRMVNELLKSQYSENYRRAESLKNELVSQIHSIISREKITLGVPLEHRVKSWDSIEEKFDRKSIELPDIRDLSDLIGIRIITLFEKDAQRFEDIFRESFDVIDFEYTGSRLSDSQFGYQSRHFVAKIKSEWENVPTLKGMTDFKFEVQVRTLAQHIWAAASHKLQYKREDAVPQGLKRSIHRISALLETVDLELARLQQERETYDQTAKNIVSEPNDLNVETVRAVMSEIWPNDNADDDENYDEILKELSVLEINDSKIFADILKSNKDSVVFDDKQRALSEIPTDSREEDRRNRGVYYTLTGLTRMALSREFGEKYDEMLLVEYK
ncbi:GTP pyrophosphokinase [Sphingopyxis sp. 22461]|uniref:GTP pyrophosphokinase n=1 Tax=Sphingopyxis sp. 22461 TaxID=3453923 RepID=UPI003F86C76F